MENDEQEKGNKNKNNYSIAYNNIQNKEELNNNYESILKIIKFQWMNIQLKN